MKLHQRKFLKIMGLALPLTIIANLIIRDNWLYPLTAFTFVGLVFYPTSKLIWKEVSYNYNLENKKGDNI